MARLLAYGLRDLARRMRRRSASVTSENPLGAGSADLHDWLVHTRTFKRMHGGGGEGTPASTRTLRLGAWQVAGAWILGRNMFGPIQVPLARRVVARLAGANPPHHAPAVSVPHAPPTTGLGHGSAGLSSAPRNRGHSGGAGARAGRGRSPPRFRVGWRCRHHSPVICQASLVDEMHPAVAPSAARPGELLTSQASTCRPSATGARSASQARRRCVTLSPEPRRCVRRQHFGPAGHLKLRVGRRLPASYLPRLRGSEARQCRSNCRRRRRNDLLESIKRFVAESLDMEIGDLKARPGRVPPIGATCAPP